MIILTTVLLFASNKLAHLVGRNNPLMSQWHVDILDQKLNMNQERFRFAISIEDFQPPRKQKNSKSYVQWVFRLWSKSKEHGVESSFSYEVHVPMLMTKERLATLADLSAGQLQTQVEKYLIRLSRTV